MKNGLRERLLLDYGWRFALGNANDPDKDFGFGKLSRRRDVRQGGRAMSTGRLRLNSTIRRGPDVDLPHDWAVELPFVNDPILVEHGGQGAGARIS